VAVGDAAADGEADAGAFVFAAAMEALEHGKDFFGVFGVEADAVVLDGEFTGLAFGGTRMPATVGATDELGGDVDLWRFGSGTGGWLEFEGVGDDVL